MEHVVEINGKTYPLVQDYVIGYNQTWNPGAERDMTGTWNGTVLGNFDQLKFSVMPESRSSLSSLIADLRTGIINVKYFDFQQNGMITRAFYRANFEVKAIYISELETSVEIVNLSFIPERRNP